MERAVIKCELVVRRDKVDIVRAPGQRGPAVMNGSQLLRQQRFARFGTPPAGFGTDAAMFHPLAVFFADGAAAFAGLDTGAELRAGELEIGPGEAGDDARRREADIGA